MTPDLFDHARTLRDVGMARASGAELPPWKDRAYEALVRLAKAQAEIHVDDLLAVVSRPNHPNAFGAVWMRAIRGGIIERSGAYRPSKDPTKRVHQYPIYRSLIRGN